MNKWCVLILITILLSSTVKAKAPYDGVASCRQVLENTYFELAMDYPKRDALIQMAALGVIQSDVAFSPEKEVSVLDAMKVAVSAAGALDEAYGLADGIDTPRSEGILLYAKMRHAISLQEFEQLKAGGMDGGVDRQSFVGWLSIFTGIGESEDNSMLMRYADMNTIDKRYLSYYAKAVKPVSGFPNTDGRLLPAKMLTYEYMLMVLDAFELPILKRRGIQKQFGYISALKDENAQREIAIEAEADVLHIKYPVATLDFDGMQGSIPVLYKGQADTAAILQKGDSIWYYTKEEKIVLIQIEAGKPRAKRAYIIKGKGYVYDPKSGALIVDNVASLGGGTQAGLQSICVSPTAKAYQWEGEKLLAISREEMAILCIDRPMYIIGSSDGGVFRASGVIMN